MTKEIPRHKVVDNYVFLCTFMRANTAQKMAYSGGPNTTSISFHRSVGGNRSPGSSLIEMQVLFDYLVYITS